MSKARSSTAENAVITICGVAAIAGWFMIPDQVFDIFYGRYGAVLMGALTAAIAVAKRRNPVAWFAAGMWFVLAAVIVACIVSRLAEAICPFCKEAIQADASVCPHCRRDLIPKGYKLPRLRCPRVGSAYYSKVFLTDVETR